jgi:hypothetical protein
MEVATTLRPPHVTVLANRLVVDGLVVDDRCTVELVRARAEAGEDPARVVAEAVEIGARVLDREQAGAVAEVFRADLEKSTRAAEAALQQRAAELAEAFGRKFDEAFGAENGRMARELERLFSDGSSAAVQHKVREVVTQAAARMQTDMVKQFSAADGTNPLSDFKNATIRVQHQQLQVTEALRLQLGELQAEVARLHAEKEKSAEVAAEHDRSTAKGRPYEEAVFDAVEAIAGAHGDLAEAVGDEAGTGGRKGDVVIGLDGCAGPARARIVVEAKHSQVGRKAALQYLDEAMEQRDAAFGIWVVPSEAELPARTVPLRMVNGDKLFVVFSPDDGSRLALEVAYALGRAQVVLSRGDAAGLDGPTLRAEVERALGALEDERRIKAQLTSATNNIADARKIVETMGAVVRGHLREIDRLVAEADGDDSPVQQPLL